MEPGVYSSYCLIVETPCLRDRKEGLPRKDDFQRRVSGWQVVSVGCLCGLGSRNQLAPFTTTPASVKCQQAGEGGGETSKLLTQEMLGRGRSRPRLPDSYFGICCDWAQPWQGRGLYMGAMNWRSARSRGEEAAESGGGGLWSPSFLFRPLTMRCWVQMRLRVL